MDVLGGRQPITVFSRVVSNLAMPRKCCGEDRRRVAREPSAASLTTSRKTSQSIGCEFKLPIRPLWKKKPSTMRCFNQRQGTDRTTAVLLG